MKHQFKLPEILPVCFSSDGNSVTLYGGIQGWDNSDNIISPIMQDTSMAQSL